MFGTSEDSGGLFLLLWWDGTVLPVPLRSAITKTCATVMGACKVGVFSYPNCAFSQDYLKVLGPAQVNHMLIRSL